MSKPWMNTYWTGGRGALYKADARKIPLPDKSVHCVVTSPPYWGLRNYGLVQWRGGDAECGHAVTAEINTRPTAGQERGGDLNGAWRKTWPNNTCGLCGAVNTSAGIGLEPTLDEWVGNIVAVMREVWRVLRDDGIVWLNLGDAYSNDTKWGGSTGGKHARGLHGQTDVGRAKTNTGLPPKNLMGQPWRVAFALQDDGWILRSAITWHKKNPMPESVTDRPTSSYEMVFLLTKSGSPTFWTHQDGYGSRTKPAPDYRMVGGKRMNMWRGHDYFYDADAVREPLVRQLHAPGNKTGLTERINRKGNEVGRMDKVWGNPSGANARNVWSISTQGRPDAHFATFPDELPRRCILAGTSERGVCGECGAPWVRTTKIDYQEERPQTGKALADKTDTDELATHRRWRGNHITKNTQTLGWQPTCGCNATVLPAIVLDPFVGSGTTVAVAQSLGRCGIGLDLNAEYLDIAVKRITSEKYNWTPEDGNHEQTKETPEQRT